MIPCLQINTNSVHVSRECLLTSRAHSRGALKKLIKKRAQKIASLLLGKQGGGKAIQANK